MKNLTEKQAAVLRYILEFIESNPHPPTFREISSNFDITVRAAWDHIKALEKKGYVTSSKHQSRALTVNPDLINASKKGSPDSLVEIPILGVVAAGYPVNSVEVRDGSIHLPAKMLGNGQHFALRVRGESMIQAGILDGDLAVIKQQNDARSGEIVVAMVDDEVTLKRFIKESNRVQLKAENPNFPPIYTKEIRILGVLSQIIRNYRSAAL